MVTSQSDCSAVEPLLPGYVIDALDDTERKIVETHLASCDRHAEELAAFGGAVEHLAALAPELDPPAGLRDRVLAIPRQAARAQGPAPAWMPPPPVALPQPRGRQWIPYTLAAAFAALALFMGAWNVMLMNRDSGSDLRVVNAVHDTVTTHAVYVPSEQVVVLEVRGLPDAPPRHDYQLWVIPPDGAPQSTGVFQAVGGAVLTTMRSEMDNGWTIAVTLEPAGGSDLPTTDPVGAVTF